MQYNSVFKRVCFKNYILMFFWNKIKIFYFLIKIKNHIYKLSNIYMNAFISMNSGTTQKRLLTFPKYEMIHA